MRWLRRWRCHRSIVCCQYIDDAMCNSMEDHHRLGRWAFRRRARHLEDA